MDTMKSRQLLTSFLACMALWSAPVYAEENTDYAYEVQKQYQHLLNTPSVEAYEAFLQKYTDFLNELNTLLKTADQKESRKEYRKSVKKAKRMLKNLAGKNVITNTEHGKYTKKIGFNNEDYITLKGSPRNREETLNNMKEFYKKMKDAEETMRQDVLALKTKTQSEGS